MSGPSCWFASLPDAGPCEGQLVRCHLVDQQRLRIEFPRGAHWLDPETHGSEMCVAEHIWTRDPLASIRTPMRSMSLKQLQDDPRSWVWGCGGATGLEGHHGRFDGRKLRVERSLLPAGLEEFAAELGLGWWLDRRYGVVGALGSHTASECGA